jgi:hypothetical protein
VSSGGMSERKNLRILAAVGFLAGVLACLDAVRDARVLWPPEALWNVLQHRQHLELVAGIALILVTIVTNIVGQGA